MRWLARYAYKPPACTGTREKKATDYRVVSPERHTAMDWLPCPEALVTSHVALWEHPGLLYYRARG